MKKYKIVVNGDEQEFRSSMFSYSNKEYLKHLFTVITSLILDSYYRIGINDITVTEIKSGLIIQAKDREAVTIRLQEDFDPFIDGLI